MLLLAEYILIKLKNVKQTISPSMDIQLPSNLERYMYDLFSKNNDLVKIKLNELNKNKKVFIDKNKIKEIQNYFKSSKVSEKDTLKTIKVFFNKYDIILDPHTAIGIAADKDKKLSNRSRPREMAQGKISFTLLVSWSEEMRSHTEF